MKILYIIESFGPGGKERRLSQLIDSLLKLGGYEIGVIVTAEIFHYKNVLNEKIELNQIDKNLGFGKKSGIYQFYKICKRFKPDIIHTWGGLVTLFAIPSSILCNIPLVNGQVTANSKIPYWNFLFFYRIPFLFSKVITTNSEAAIKRYSISKRKAICIYNGFDFDRINNLSSSESIRKELNIKTEFLVGMVASFVPLKDYKTFIQAATVLLKQNYSVTFFAIGQGNFDKYQDLISKVHKKNFIFLNAKQNIENYMNACDIGVLSSFNEGMPNTVIEFMALGKPIIATRVGGIPELVSHNVDGYLFQTGDYIELSNLIISLLKNENQRNKMGRLAAEKVKSRFSLRKMTDEYNSLYLEITKLD
jgi:glycosyltransferase involved in cell wall biosynthesis